MVRIVCQNFQRPRSRHTSGESVSSVSDVDSVPRSTQPLGPGVEARELAAESDCGLSSDSIWESDGGYSVDMFCKNNAAEREAILNRRKQRRRERNKVSAQAYRARRKEQDLSQKKTLTALEEQHKELLRKLQALEHEKSQLETFLRSSYIRNKTVPWRAITNNDVMPLANIHEGCQSPPPQTVPEAMNIS